MKITIIGYKNHALRLRNILHELRFSKIYNYNYHKDSISDFEDSDAFIIASPNETHIEWIEKLHSSGKYIFCEKPPVTNLRDLNKIKSFINGKLYFNFNYRHTLFAKNISNYLRTNEIGKLINLNFVSTHGLAFKSSYQNDWRFKGNNLFSSIIGNVGIHYVDLVGFICGGISNIKVEKFSVISNELPDTAKIRLNTKLCYADVLLSYAAPFRNQATSIFDNGILEFLDGELTIQKPREVYDDNGRFMPPKKKHLNKIPMTAKQYYDQSLKDSINYFLNFVKNNSNISLEEQLLSIQNTKIFLESQQNY